MREGILIADTHSDRVDIRFGSDDCYGGLHCGTIMDVWMNGRWIPTRIEMGSQGWFLVRIDVESILGLKVRI